MNTQTTDLNSFNQSMVGNKQPGITGITSVNFLNTPTQQPSTPAPSVISNANIGSKIQDNNQNFQQLSQPYNPSNQGMFGVDQQTINNFKQANPGMNFTSEDADYLHKQDDQANTDAQKQSYYTPESQQIQSGLANLQKNSDDISKQYLQSIQDKYNQLEDEQRTTNSRVENSVRGMLAMGGSNASGSDANSLLNQTILDGQKSIQKLATQEQSAYLEALQAKQAGDERLFDKKVADLQTIRNAKIQDAQTFNENVQKQADKVQEERRQSDQENSVADLYSQGITDPAKIMQTLRAQGKNVPASVVKDTVALVSGIGGTGIMAEYNFAKSQGWKGTGDPSTWFSQYQDEDANRKKVVAAASQDPNRMLTPTEAAALNVPYGTTALQAYGKSVTKPPTDTQLKSAGYAQRMATSVPTIDKLSDDIAKMASYDFLYQTSLENTTLGNSMPYVTDEIKQLRQAERDFATAKLRPESGASISPTEFETLAKQYFPRPGDDATTLESKKVARQNAMNGLIKEAGPAYGGESSTPSVGENQQQTEQQAFSTVQSYLQAHPEQEKAAYNLIQQGIQQTGQEPTSQDLVRLLQIPNQSFNTVGSGTNQASDPKKGIVLGVNIKPYATDPQHEVKIASIVNKIPPGDTFDYDKYIRSIAPQSKITGDMITTASSTYGIDPRLLVAIIQNDSSFGTKGHGARNNNPGNIGQFDNLKGSVKGYKTLQDGILAVAKWLSNHKTNIA